MNKFFLICFVSTLLVTDSGLQAASRDPVRAKKGMVVAADPIAANVGLKILREGGNAIDAAVAVGFALAVTYPGAGNIGGGGFMVLRLADGTVRTLDYRETAPSKATRDMFLDKNGNFAEERSTKGHLSCGVPGSVAGMIYAQRRYGRLMRAEVIKPAIQLAEKGFHLHYRLADDLERMIPEFSRYRSSKKAFTRNGRPYKEGDLFRQPDLAKTLKRIKDKGRDGFYKGETAKLIIAEMKRGGGLIDADDLENYASIIRDPVRGTYRGYEIISVGPPSSGGVALVELLNILEGYNLSHAGWNSSKSVHWMAEAMKRVYADRAEFLGDPDFVKVPVAWLTSKKYAEQCRLKIDSSKATPSDEISHGTQPRKESDHTTHYSVVDRWGNCVSVTTTLNDPFGSKVVVTGAGFLLNDEMDDFSAKPGAPNEYGLTGSDANEIAPNKRMLSSMTPTIVLKDDEPFMIVGTPGGSTIVTTVAQVIINVVDYRMTIQEAIDAPRIHHQWLPDRLMYEERALSEDTIERLRTMGYSLHLRDNTTGLAEGILFDRKRGLLLGASDPRGYGEAVGY
ncbi:MAG TPA: gamma-glutamyltransferase [Bacteroidota bacterium]|nr:gamma-glutamyltransferase [Bacteroidota bacterium]